MTKLKLNQIIRNAGVQPRQEINSERVELYAEAMKDGDAFPVPTVHTDGKTYWLSSGFHRVAAYERNGAKEIECEIIQGNLDDAMFYALGANAKQGLPLASEDFRLSVKRLIGLPMSKDWTVGQMARYLGCSKMTVSRHRTKLINEGVQAQPVKRAVNFEKPREQPEVFEKPEDNNDKLVELADTVQDLSAENQRLRDMIAVGQWDATEIEKVDVEDTIKELRQQIQNLEIDNQALRDSRDMFQARNAELMKTVKALQAKIKKLETA
jgi:uncharacterized ParB-like nuclease family protein